MQYQSRSKLGLTRHTVSATHDQIPTKWVLIDAQGLVVGRLASLISIRLRGKHQPFFTPHVNCGDAVVVINAEKVQFTGRKREEKTYFRHTGYPGGLKEKTAEEILDGQHPERVILMAVKRMMPGGPLARKQLRSLRVYPGPEHPHQAQNPELLDVIEQDQKITGKNGMKRKSAGDDVRAKILESEERIRDDFKRSSENNEKIFGEFNDKFESMDDRLINIEERLGSIEASIDNLNKGLSAILSKIEINTRKDPGKDPSP